jgi:hypothetical protein
VVRIENKTYPAQKARRGDMPMAGMHRVAGEHRSLRVYSTVVPVTDASGNPPGFVNVGEILFDRKRESGFFLRCCRVATLQALRAGIVTLLHAVA